MKRSIIIVFLATIGLMATDYSSYSAEELAAMRGSVTAEEKDAFKEALQAALAKLTPEERREIMSKKPDHQSGSMTHSRTRSHSNTAMEAMNVNSSGEGSGHGNNSGGHGGGGHGGHR